MRAIGGKVLVSIDGERVLVRGSVTSNIGQDRLRETVVGVDEVHGFTDTVVAPFLQVDVTEIPEFPLSRFNAVTDATVTAELADGRTLILSHAAQIGELERNAEDGSIGSVRFEGTKGQEMAS